MSGYRLARGGRIDRDRRLEFIFNGRPLYGYAGDTLASALIASGADVVARSFKYRCPRGVIGAGEEEPNAVLQLGEGARAGGAAGHSDRAVLRAVRAHGQLLAGARIWTSAAR